MSRVIRGLEKIDSIITAAIDRRVLISIVPLGVSLLVAFVNAMTLIISPELNWFEIGRQATFSGITYDVWFLTGAIVWNAVILEADHRTDSTTDNILNQISNLKPFPNSIILSAFLILIFVSSHVVVYTHYTVISIRGIEGQARLLTQLPLLVGENRPPFEVGLRTLGALYALPAFYTLIDIIKRWTSVMLNAESN